MNLRASGAPRRSWYPHAGKRILDLTLAGSLSVLALPVALAVGVLVRAKLGTPVLFRQERPGLNGETFRIVKFRSMTDERSRDGHLLPDAQRLTRFGRFLRSSSLDELPELWNVLCGDMSMIGPRPLRVHYLDRYSVEQARRHLVRPGVTGWAQVNGRNAADWEDRLTMDVWYVDNVGFRVDLRILWRTVSAVIRRDGISASGHATVSEFRGSSHEAPATVERPPELLSPHPDAI